MSNNKKTARKYSRNESKSWEKRESRDMKRDNKKRRASDKFEDAEMRAGANDVSWYIPDMQLLHDVASLPWSEQAGQNLAQTGQVYGKKYSVAYPGVAAMKVVPTLGKATKPNDAVNSAAQAIYTFVRHANSGSKNYDPTDLMMYIMSLDSIYYMVSWITRLYATANMYSMQNKYLPDLLFKAQNVDGASIRADLPGFRARINSLIMKISTLVIPNTMPIFKRHSFLFTNYYTEGTTIKDQIYMYVPDGYYSFHYDSDGKGFLQYNKVPSLTPLTADIIYGILRGLVDNIYMEEDFGIMAGDILKAYGEGGIEKIGLIPEVLTAQPVYNYAVLMQFKNAKCHGYKLAANWNITQVVDPDYPISPYIVQYPGQVDHEQIVLYNAVDGDGTTTPLYKHTLAHSGLKYSYWLRFINEVSKQNILVSDNPVVSPEESMVSTRLTTDIQTLFVPGDSSDSFTAVDYTYGTEWPVSVTYWGNSYYDGTLTQEGLTLEMWTSISNNGATWTGLDETYAIQNHVAIPTILANFHYHPEHNIGYLDNVLPVTDSEGCWVSDLPILDIDNYTHVSYDTLDKMHSIATLGEFNVPRLSLG